MSINGHLLKLKCSHLPLNLRILSSASVPFTLTTGASAKFSTNSQETDYYVACECCSSFAIVDPLARWSHSNIFIKVKSWIRIRIKVKIQTGTSHNFYVDTDPNIQCCGDPCGARSGSATRVSKVITGLWIRICIRIDLHYLSRWIRIQIGIQKSDPDPDLGGQNWAT